MVGQNLALAEGVRSSGAVNAAALTLPPPMGADFEHIGGGVHVAGSVVWCDADRKAGLNFLSSARAGEMGKGRRWLCTEATLRLCTRGRGKIDALVAPYGQSLSVGNLTLSLHPSGHLLGGATLRIEREGRVLVYAAEISTRRSATAPPAEPPRCDALALLAPWAMRGLVFPPRDEVLADLGRFIDAALADGRTPVLLAPPLGIGVELLVGLGRAGYRLRAHRAVADVAKLYAELGISVPPHKRLGARVPKGEVLIVPPILRASLDALVPDARVALVGPRAADAAHVHQARVARAFPLSDSADGPELLGFVAATGARDVYLTGGEVEVFAARLRELGITARPLLPPRQLELF